MEKLVCKSNNKSVVDFILFNLPEINYSTVQKLLRKKDIKINGVRIKTDCKVVTGDIVEVYAPLKPETKEVAIVYNDDNIVVVNKPAGIEVVSDETESLLTRLTTQLGISVYAVHRLDFNTTGLVIFATNIKAKEQLEQAFKNHTIKKYYLAMVVGTPKKQADKLVAYHKKDGKNAVCYISDSPKPGYSKILTNYTLLKTNDILSVLQVEIETGKTHQIRAHLAHVGNSVLGDEKYGNKQVNKQFKKKKQMLVAYKLCLDKSVLGYSVTIELPNAKQEMLNAL